MSAQQWIRSSLRQVQQRLAAAGYAVSVPTVRRLLGVLRYALHVNAKKVSAHSRHADRDLQFAYLAAQRRQFAAAGWPSISVDTKKKELVGNFKNAGRRWGRAADAVDVHDFPHEALGRAVPYGIYDLTRNCGTVVVGQSADTPQFAVEAIARWWTDEGRTAFAGADHLLILADGGGSNSARSRGWKQQLQVQLCDRLGLSVTVGHYPPGCSKWNPIEHRLFSQISRNWAGIPLRTWETMLALLRGTTTQMGLQVRAVLQPAKYAIGQTVSNAELAALNLTRHAVCPAWNYTLQPRLDLPARSVSNEERGLIS